MKNLYARIVLWLIRPALEQAQRERSAMELREFSALHAVEAARLDETVKRTKEEIRQSLMRGGLFSRL